MPKLNYPNRVFKKKKDSTWKFHIVSVDLAFYFMLMEECMQINVIVTWLARTKLRKVTFLTVLRH